VTRVIIFRASARPEVGCTAHLPAGAALPQLGPGLLLTPRQEQTVLRTVCGQVGIGRLFDRDGPSCALCLAMSGQHPGKRGKAWLLRNLGGAR
jgi:hypothetical protein